MPSEPILIDARNLRCPLPVLRLEKALGAAGAGTAFVVLATDPMARIDIPLHCRQHGHACSMTIEDEVYRFSILSAG
ncbi:sulfurtransferase TusA family protein [Devosia enhydra]|uniref:sulfurtransferase TusA family protein n=1 Tax=Devosia enhydra TaxID=665118 RepID=UPI00093187C8|nr:sulfurtransferase TusA family protein [Devosia enhydra]